MISVMNIAKSNSIGVLMKSVKAQHLSLGNKCIFPILPKQCFKVVCTSTASFSTPGTTITSLSTKQTAILKNPKSRNMSADHSHSKIWTAERFLSAALVGIVPLALAYPNPAVDYALALALTAHVHWGIEAIVVDYARPNVIGAALSKAALGGVYALTVFTLGGLFYFNYSDVGLSQAIRMLWKL